MIDEKGRFVRKYPDPNIGDKFGKWTVIGETEKSNGNNNRVCLCLCECGTTKKVIVVKLYNGESKSCRCATEESKKENRRRRNERYATAYPERVKESLLRSREKNREKSNKTAAEYRRTHKENYRIHCVVRRTRKTQAGGSFTPEEWFLLCFSVGFKCLMCGEKKFLTPDHVVPVSMGGTSWLHNIQPLCKTCNSKKHAKTTDYRTEENLWAQKSELSSEQCLAPELLRFLNLNSLDSAQTLSPECVTRTTS